MTIKARMEGSPVFVSLTAVMILAGGLTAFGSLSGMYNSSHTSQLELSASHPVSSLAFDALKDSIVAGDTLSKCRWLKSEIRALSDSIYVRTRDNGDKDFIRAMQNDLDDLQEQYDDLSCTRRLNKT